MIKALRNTFLFVVKVLSFCPHVNLAGGMVPFYRLNPPKGESRFYRPCLDCGKDVDQPLWEEISGMRARRKTRKPRKQRRLPRDIETLERWYGAQR